jgi:dTDP-4-dehydrorhamnose reductase
MGAAMIILVTGGLGFIGSNFVRPRVDNAEIIVVDALKYGSNETNLKDIHTAALTNVDECEANQELAYKINVAGTKIADKFGLDKDLILPSRMEELNRLAYRPKDSSLDSSKALRYLKEEPYHLDKALTILKEEIENAPGGIEKYKFKNT